MARVTLTIEDRGSDNLLVTVDSEPGLPITAGELDVDELTPSQAAGIAAARAIGKAGNDYSELVL